MADGKKRRRGGATTMIRIVLLVLGLGLLVVPTMAHAQNVQPKQSLQTRPSACGIGSQSIRVCENDLRSCNSVCEARALDPSAVVAGCATRCCTQYNVCLRLRGCGSRGLQCN